MALTIAAFVAMPAAADDARAIDGDTIALNGTTYRLWGMDAAEARQRRSDGWPAGVEASKALLELMAGHMVTCEA